MKKILIMGLPGSGKTYLSNVLKKIFKCAHFNADEVRKMSNDWSFDETSRERQAKRMKNIADFEVQFNNVICDFVCPTEETRKIFDADIIIFMNTIEKSRYEDTNTIFEKPKNPDIEITKKLSILEINELAQRIWDEHFRDN